MSSPRSEIQYNQVLQRLVNAVRQDVDAQLLPVIEAQVPEYVQDAWGDNVQAAIDRLVEKYRSDGFLQLAQRMASGFVGVTLQVIDRKNKRSFGIDVLQASPKLRFSMQAAAIQNAGLIKSIPEQYLRDVANTVFSNMRIGLLPREIAKRLEDDYGVAQRRARFIARDQTAKVNGELTKQRQIDAGYEYFKWLDSDDERVRARHRKIAEADVGYGPGVYRWDDLPKSDDGQPIQPGSDYQCRCTSRPVRNSKVERHRKAA
ncbi:minor capsid protein [Castellaniella ginsengisoli]|uniref:Minor capsid protein n=1 Tax=Castellaniella ginsengisoli TaxID=546114 RepID=A0AB39DND5_9BURK